MKGEIVNHLNLDGVDTDGAVREAMDKVSGDTRGDFLRKTLAAGGIVGGGAAFAALAAPGALRAASAGDVNILNFALTLEYLEAEFYTEAEGNGALKGKLANFAQVVGAHERAHVDALKQVLGSAAVVKPKFDFQGTTENAKQFGATAQTLEDTGVAAYKGAAPSVESDDVLKSALAIHSVEARHAAWIRHLLNADPAPAAFDEPLSTSEVLAAVQSTNFIQSPLMTRQGAAPAFTG